MVTEGAPEMLRVRPRPLCLVSTKSSSRRWDSVPSLTVPPGQSEGVGSFQLVIGGYRWAQCGAGILGNSCSLSGLDRH